MTSFQNGSNLISSAKAIVSPNPHDEHQDSVAEIKFKKKKIENIQTHFCTWIQLMYFWYDVGSWITNPLSW